MSDAPAFDLDSVPYARFLGLSQVHDDSGLTVVMPFSPHLIGNPMLPALHGGSTAALLELTATAQLALLHPRARLPRPINITVAYLRSGKPLDTRARAHVSKAGRRIASVTAEAWQDDPDQPIASLTAHFLLDNQ